MIRIEVEAIEKFNLKDFDKLENVKRIDKDIYGTLFVGDTFDCDEKMYDYLIGNNPLNKAMIKKIKIKEITEKTDELEEVVEEVKEKKSKKKKKK